MPETSPYEKLRNGIASAVKGALLSLGYSQIPSDTDILQTIVPSRMIGDISSSIAFRIANSAKEKADKVAERIVSGIALPDVVEKAMQEKGFINFFLKKREFSAEVLDYALKPNKKEKGVRAIVEYISVNPNKPWHVGHLRNALLGNTIANIYDALGYDVVRQNYIDDLGLQVVESLWGYSNLGRQPGKKFDQWLGEEYVEVNKRMSEKEVQDEIKQLLAAAERAGSAESRMLRELSERCVRAQYETAFSYGIYQDVMIWESDIVRAGLLQNALDILSSYGAIEKPESGDYKRCIVINLEKMKDVPKDLKGLKESTKVLVRSDGTATYVAKDIAFHMWKFGMIKDTFNYDVFIKQPNGVTLYTTSQAGSPGQIAASGGVSRSINVIDAAQSYPQAILRLAFSAIGRNDIAEGIVHLAYGEVALEEGKLSGRSGNWIGFSADDILVSAKSKAKDLITERFKFSEEDRERIAKAVAKAAVIFEFLKVSPEKEIVFSWERALSFEGNSGPYCQYMHARASRIVESAKAAGFTGGYAPQYPFENAQEFEMLKQVSLLDWTIGKAGAELRPNVLVEYLGTLSGMFSTFYEALPILKACTKEERDSRTAITLAVMNSMRKVLKLLGIDAVERM